MNLDLSNTFLLTLLSLFVFINMNKIEVQMLNYSSSSRGDLGTNTQRDHTKVNHLGWQY